MRIAFLGDTLLGGDAAEVLGASGHRWALSGLAPLLDGADLVVANHEGPITTNDRRAHKDDTGRRRWWYRADAASAEALAGAGVGLVSLANNHVCDHGPGGLADTFAALDAAEIARCGAGAQAREAAAPVTMRVGGTQVSFASAMQRYRLCEQERVYAEPGRPGVALLDPAALDLGDGDVRIALVHWGRNYRPLQNRQRRLAEGVLAAGADLVVGTHPHVAHPVELRDGRAVLYSLGNGAFGTKGRWTQRGAVPYGLVATADLDGDGLAALELALIAVDNRTVRYRPEPARDPAFLASLVEPEAGWEPTADGGLRVELR